ncbi:response regulator [Halarcobacter ebronensis]|uniref:Response regulator n=1 Tax=Halarcobacter ebronensis TaxID=1462615 RepID=A0A4Q1AZ70_9BACT|nr:response regulator [Halarcobacter ebronensis]QKF82525.1 two-component system response regulator [Halarcobacter ebronensis]RXK07458.1 response regulator [Halarcobacter ebronensis]
MKKVLLIDDDELVSYALSRYLEKKDFEVETLSSGLKAIEKYKNFNPDIIITDIIMPDVEGLELITALRKIDTNIPIIAISGGSRRLDTSYLISAELIGANATLEKPFEEEELVELINSLTK